MPVTFTQTQSSQPVDGLPGDPGAQMLGIVSHELHTPLNAIIGFAELLAAPRPLSEAERMEYAKFIAAGGRDLLASVNALLDLSRIVSGHYTLQLEALDAFSMLEQCCRAVCGDAEVVIEGDGQQKMPISADRKALTAILTNLISNAFKFTESERGRIDLAVLRAGPGVAFEITDNGCGMSEEFLTHLNSSGAAFRQEKMDYRRPVSGTGIGLGIVKGLVKLHGARLTIKSKQGAGTKVSVWLPDQAAGQFDETALGTAA
jgi:signal transduction histidine kinase